MKLYYYIDPEKNFGDDLNPWLWSKLIPEYLDDDEKILFVGIGTLLNNRIPPAAHHIVFGSGAGYGEKLEYDSSWTFICVRGPLTAQSLGLDQSLVVTDAAALVAKFVKPESNRRLVSYIPHHASQSKADWRSICQSAGLNYIDVSAPVEEVLQQINRSKLVIAEAMHGAIIADTLRVPWVPVKCYSHILDFKWQDWCASLDMRYAPESLPEVWDAERFLSPKDKLKNHVKRAGIRIGMGSGWEPPPPIKSSRLQFDALIERLVEISRNSHSNLSDDKVFTRALERLEDKLELVRNHDLVKRAC